jgi:hypothetical protein
MSGEKEESGDADLLSILGSPMPSREFEMEWYRNGKLIKKKLRVQLLSASQNMASIAAAQEYAKGKEGGDYGDIYREAQAHEILSRAIVATEEKTRHDGTKYYMPIFPTAEMFRANLTEPEQSVLLGYYIQVKSEFGPISSLSDVSLEQWIQRLKGPMATDFLGRLDSLHWPALIFTLAQVVDDLSGLLGLIPSASEPTSESDQTSSTEDTGSSISPPIDSSTETTPDPSQVSSSSRLLTKDELQERAKDIFGRKFRE